MANIAQTINVLQAMILTDEEKMLLTPDLPRFRNVPGAPGRHFDSPGLEVPAAGGR